MNFAGFIMPKTRALDEKHPISTRGEYPSQQVIN
jgi:hypothetical protein